jgi:hypothetical protein
MIELELKRRKYRDKQVIGTMDVYKDNEFICTISTLERAWLNNERNKSCIPPGFYIVHHYDSDKHPNSFIIAKTDPRTSILIHSGNYYNHSAGCILVGLTHEDINGDGYYDVKHSQEAYDKLRDICKGETIISININ